MSSSNRCDKCMGQRWQFSRAAWKDDALAVEWRAFDSGFWQQYGQAAISSMLASKALRACPTCNPKRIAPWSKSWKSDTSSAAAPQQGGVDDTPF